MMIMCRNILIFVFSLFCISCAKAETLYTKQNLPVKPKGKINVELALKNAVHQYLYMRDKLSGSAAFPKTYDANKLVIPNGGVVVFIPEHYFIFMRQPVMTICIERVSGC